jgi:ribosomal subunit interface protein
MHVYIAARHFQLTDAIREHIERHIVTAAQRHADAHDLNRIEVQLATGQRDARYTCHVLVQLPGHRDINISEHDHDLYAAINNAEKRLVSTLVNSRERLLTQHRHPRKFSWRKIARLLKSLG